MASFVDLLRLIRELENVRGTLPRVPRDVFTKITGKETFERPGTYLRTTGSGSVVGKIEMCHGAGTGQVFPDQCNLGGDEILSETIRLSEEYSRFTNQDPSLRDGVERSRMPGSLRSWLPLFVGHMVRPIAVIRFGYSPFIFDVESESIDLLKPRRSSSPRLSYTLP